jgi:hypothetical protein
MMDGEPAYDRNKILSECLKNKHYDIAYYLALFEFDLDRYIYHRIRYCSVGTFMDILDELKYLTSIKLIILQKVLIVIKNWDFPHKDDIIQFIEQNIDEETKKFIYDH